MDARSVPTEIAILGSYTCPINLQTTFLVQVVEQDPNWATVWLTNNGLIICVSRNFTDLMAFTHADVSGRCVVL